MYTSCHIYKSQRQVSKKSIWYWIQNFKSVNSFSKYDIKPRVAIREETGSSHNFAYKSCKQHGGSPGTCASPTSVNLRKNISFDLDFGFYYFIIWDFTPKSVVCDKFVLDYQKDSLIMQYIDAPEVLKIERSGFPRNRNCERQPLLPWITGDNIHRSSLTFAVHSKMYFPWFSLTIFEIPWHSLHGMLKSFFLIFQKFPWCIRTRFLLQGLAVLIGIMTIFSRVSCGRKLQYSVNTDR